MSINFTPSGSLPPLNVANTVEILSPNVLKQGDTQNEVRVRLKHQETNVNFTNTTVTWSAAGAKGTVIVDRPANLLENGEVSFSFTEEDKAAWGTLRIEFKLVDNVTGKTEKFPANDHVRLHVTRSHDDLNHTPVLFASISYFNQKVEEAAESAEQANQRALLVEGQGALAQTRGEFAQEQGEFAQEYGGLAKDIADNTKFVESYNVTSTYKENNVVSFNGASYMAKQTTTGNAPTDDPSDLNWGLLSRKGTDGTGTVHVHKEIFEATEGQTVFTLANTYDQFQYRTSVFVGRVPQDWPENYEETTPNSITLAEGVPAGTSVKVEYFSESIPLQSDIQTTVDNHTGVITDHTLKLEETETALDQREISVAKFGAKGDDIADDTQAFIATRDYVIANGGTFFVPSSFVCFLPNGVDLFGVRNIKIEGTIRGMDATKELIVGVRSGITLVFKGHINRTTLLKVKVQGIKNGELILNSSPHLLLWADSNNVDTASLAYSRFHLGKVDHVEINSIGGEMAWINENKFFGGRLSQLTIDGTYTHNHNVFYSPTLENSTINIVRGSSNRVLGCRFEGTNSVTFGAFAWDNEIIRSWHNAPGSFLRGQARTSFTDNGSGNIVANSLDSVYDRIRLYNLNYNSMNFNIGEITRSGSALTVLAGGQFKNIFDSGLIPVDTDFGMQISSDSTLWRAVVEIYDSTMTRINVDTPNSVVSGEMNWVSASNIYSTPLNQSNIYIAVLKNTAVKYIKVRIQPHVLGAFSFLNVSLRKPQYTDLKFDIDNVYKKLRGSIAPTSGTWSVGDVVYNASPVASGKVGWVCVASGTPGTWKAFGAIDA